MLSIVLSEHRMTALMWNVRARSQLRGLVRGDGVGVVGGHLHTLRDGLAGAPVHGDLVWGGGVRDGDADLHAAAGHRDVVLVVLGVLARRVHHNLTPAGRSRCRGCRL